ncbi:MAG: response regulator [Ignavibacteriae bacterium]|nr:response regulator [Ignavibacteriota bacterium]
MVGEFLKRADKLIKEANFDGADYEVERALQMEPNNVYALAYRDRIKDARRLHDEKKKREDEERKVQEEALRTAKEQIRIITPQPQPEPVQQHHRIATAKEIDRYKKILVDAWRDGLITAQEIAVLKRVRIDLSITEEVHHTLEREVKLECYVDAVRKAWRDGLISPLKAGALDGLRKKYGISIEEHLHVEGKILWELQQGTKISATLFLIDDEQLLLGVLKDSLQLAGFSVLTATTPEEALQELHSVVPDLIICDIRFDNSDLDGLFIYEQVRKMPDLNTVPFIFLSGVRDDQVLKTGLELGVDDFLMKPFNTETLLAVIEGKLKRYGELKKYRTTM